MDLSFLNINPVFMIAGFAGGALIIGLAVFFILKINKKKNRISSRLDQIVVSTAKQEEESGSSRIIIQREISGSLFSRTIASWFERFIQFLGKFTPDAMAQEIDHKLTIAGNPANLTGRTFFAIRVILFVIAVIAVFIMNRDFKSVDRMSIISYGMILGLSLIFPSSWLNGQARARQDEIRRGLPDALDMLSVCASAGLGFDQSLQKISHYWKTDLGKEIEQTIQEMEMGITRSEALRNLSSRLEVNDLSQFVAIVIQAEKIGMSYAEVLSSQARQLRIMRQVRAREIANKLPGKMIIPVILFIFPAMIAVILGPTVPVLMNLF